MNSVAAHQQPHRLLERLEEIGVTHGVEAEGDLVGIEVGPTGGGMDTTKFGQTPVAFFCRMDGFNVRGVRNRGDGGPLSETVTTNHRFNRLMRKLGVTEKTRVTVTGVTITCNGAVHIQAHRRTKVKVLAEAAVG